MSAQLKGLNQHASLPVLDPSEADLAAVLEELDGRWASWEELSAPSGRGSGSEGQDAGLQLEEERSRWESESQRCTDELLSISSNLPSHLSAARESLASLLSDAQEQSLARYALADELAGLVRGVFGEEGGEGSHSAGLDGEAEGEGEAVRKDNQGETAETTLLRRLEIIQDRLEALDVARQWAGVLGHVMQLSQEALASLRSQASNSPSISGNGTADGQSALRSIPAFQRLHTLVRDMHAALPVDLAILSIASRVRSETWRALREALAERLTASLDGIGWPKRIDYPAVPPAQRKAFEGAFRDMLVMQSEADKMGYNAEGTTGEGLYPIATMLRPVVLRFRFHFEGERGTNRLDKPEWAFSSLLDFLFEQRAFVEDYLQPLVDRSAYREVDAKSEVIHQLLPIPLAMLNHRFPHLLPHPSLLAHTVYQTVVFDDAIRAEEYDPAQTWSGISQWRRNENIAPWPGLTETLLGTSDWFERWLQGEKDFADEQFNEAISSAETWTIAEADAADEGVLADLRPTVGARQVQALVEQVSDRYVSLPSPRYKLPFLLRIQLPLLEAYRQRLTSSLDAFETLSSSFLRAVPGALAGHTRENGLAMQENQMTSGTGGLQRLCKAWVSAAYMKEVLDRWNDEPHFIEFAAQVRSDSAVSREARHADSLRVDDESLFGLACERYAAVAARAEEMMIKHVAGEVERDLRPHLTRRWDKANDGEAEWQPDASLLSAMSALSSQLGLLARTLPPRTLTKQYRSVVAHLSNHIMQRAVYSGWSKFTEAGGRDFASEVGAWTEASVIGLGDHNKRPTQPWIELVEAASILALPQEPPGDDKPSFSQAMALAFGGDIERLRARLELRELSDHQIEAIMRRRIECWR